MIADKHISLVGSGTTGFGMCSSWHLRATTDLVINVRDGSITGPIIIPLEALAGVVIGNAYEAPLISTPSWYVEFVSGTGIFSMSGR